MIKKLKRRFITIYMIILSCFLITVLLGIYLIVYHSEIIQSEQIMQMSLQNNMRLENNLIESKGSLPKKIIDFNQNTITNTPANDDYSQEEYIFEFDEDYIEGTSETEEYSIETETTNNNFLGLNSYCVQLPDFWDTFQNTDLQIENENPHWFDDEDYDDYDDDYYEELYEKQQKELEKQQQKEFEEQQKLLEEQQKQLEEQQKLLEEQQKQLEKQQNEFPKNNQNIPLPPHEVQTEPPIVETNPPTEAQTEPPIVETNSPTEVQTEPPVEEPIAVIKDETVTNTDETSSQTEETSISETSAIQSTSTTEETSVSTKKVTTNNTEVSTVVSKPSEVENITEYEGNLARNTIYVKIDENGNIQRISYQYFESSDNVALEQSVGEIIKSGSMSGKTEIDDIKFRYYVFDREDNSGYDIVFLDRAIEISTLKRLLTIFVLIGGVGLIILFGVSWLLSSWAITPIAEAWDKQKQFIADASHELKTPLTVIATNTDVVLANSEDTVKNQAKWLTYIKSETARMSKLVSDLLYIAKSDVNEVTMVMNEFNLSHTVFGVCLVFESMAFERGKLLDTNIDEEISFKGDEDRIKQLITILIDNAIVHSEGNANITVNLKRDTKDKDKIELSVSNTNGEDIPQGYEERLFERFFRVDKARNRSNGSHGLGLNIAQSIVKNHNGNISVHSTKDHVVTFTVTLPS